MKIVALTRSDATKCSNHKNGPYLWIGAIFQDEERSWKSLRSNMNLNWSGFQDEDLVFNEPGYDCSAMLSGKNIGKWLRVPCYKDYSRYNFCTACEFAETPTIKIRGPILCNDSPFDKQFYLKNLENSQLEFVGFHSSSIFGDKANKKWILRTTVSYFGLYGL